MLLKNAAHCSCAMHVSGQMALDIVVQRAILSTAARTPAAADRREAVIPCLTP
jgi:hypothetical protein